MESMPSEATASGLEGMRGVLHALQQLNPANRKDENLFQIGGRGHYENPTTQLLEFFLSDPRCHGFGTQVLDVLLGMVGVELDTQQEYFTRLEVPIDEDGAKGRLDLALESSSWVVVVEDKIRHQAINDFGAYGTWARKRGKSQTLLILLSVRDEPAPEGWKVVRWLDLIATIRAKLRLDPNAVTPGKWSLFLEEFLANVEIECAGGRMMDDERYKFALENSGALYQAQDFFQEFLQDICSRWKVVLADHGGVVRQARIERPWLRKDPGGWRCIPIRFVLDHPDLEIVLKVSQTGRFGVNLYLRSGIKLSFEQIQELYPEGKAALKVERERGYLACIVADSDNLDLAAALGSACNAIKCFRGRDLTSGLTDSCPP